MASVSKYFLNLLYGEYQESKNYRIELLDVPRDTFEGIIQYAYTGSIHMVRHNVQGGLNTPQRSLYFKIKLSNALPYCNMWCIK